MAIAILLFLTSIWGSIYLLHYLLKSSKAQSLLPSSSSSFRPSRRTIWNESATQITLSGLHLRIETTAWNLRHDLFATSLKRATRARWRTTLSQAYSFGSLLGLIGMLCALGFLCTTGCVSAVSIARKLWPVAGTYTGTSSEGFGGLVKRSLDSVEDSGVLPSDGSWIKPIIPGVTVPLSHLPAILSAVFLSQVIHEFGHAIAAAIDAIPILSAGLSLTFIIPSAFVSFSAYALDALAPRARARIIAAGPFHNIVLWVLLVSLSYTPFARIFWSLGYRDVSATGQIVVGVDAHSPLHAYLPVGAVITALDDTLLGRMANASHDAWTSYLVGAQANRTSPQGWCIAGPVDVDLACCTTPSPGRSCFVSTSTPSSFRCLDPAPLLTSTHTNTTARCTTTADCHPGDGHNAVCMRPDAKAQLLRLRVGSTGDIILWSGPRKEVYEEVRVSTLVPRLRVIPHALPHAATLFWEYLVTASLSLYFFNLLPLPFLDGSQFLTTLLQMIFDEHSDANTSPGEYELDLESEVSAPSRRARRRARWKGVLGRVIPRVTTGVFFGCAVLGLIDAYL
ncbi:hypothetical protein DXG03_004744 [Asterophora parasitica]|uniref:Endopeptidase S2P n=1 Tax=Asterophora parasitica TaxID=117018 RepID=A0A9P7GEZ5_9AGAR|nr:hypothetical protein DXG03_004744 [Asterophora parasitica]